MIRNHWKTIAGKIVPLAVLILATVATSEQIHAQAQTSQQTRTQSTRQTTPVLPQTKQRPGTNTASTCLVPKSPECLEARINELTTRAAALERDLNAIKDLLQRVDEELQKHGGGKDDLAGTIASIWKAIGELQRKTKDLD